MEIRIGKREISFWSEFKADNAQNLSSHLARLHPGNFDTFLHCSSHQCDHIGNWEGQNFTKRQPNDFRYIKIISLGGCSTVGLKEGWVG